MLGEFFKIDSTAVGNDLLCFFLIGKKVGISPQEAKHSIKEALNSSLLLDHGHENAIELVIFTHVDVFKVNYIDRPQIIFEMADSLEHSLVIRLVIDSNQKNVINLSNLESTSC